MTPTLTARLTLPQLRQVADQLNTGAWWDAWAGGYTPADRLMQMAEAYNDEWGFTVDGVPGVRLSAGDLEAAYEVAREGED